MDEEKDKNKTLDYKPNIEYKEDYSTLYDGYIFSDYDSDIEDEDDEGIFDQSYMDHIQETIDELIELIPNLTPEFQTAINQVFKPIFNDWYKNLKKKKYPTKIPDEDKPIIIAPEDEDPIIGKPPVWEGPEIDPTPHPYEPWQPDPGPIYDPWKPVFPDPNHITPWDPGVVYPKPKPTPFPGNDEIFEPGTPFKIIYEEITPVEKIELEYVKNLAELYNYYTERLKKAIGQYYLTFYQAIITSGRHNTGGDNLAQYFLDGLSMNDATVTDTNLKHLVDVTVRNEINGYNKLSFFTNMFSLESTLYHTKNFKAAYELRLRYEKEQMSSSSDNVNAMSNRMLTGSRENYNKKYDNAYINLYKYLNSSVNVLEDVFRTYTVALKAKDTLYKKGGTSK